MAQNLLGGLDMKTQLSLSEKSGPTMQGQMAVCHTDFLNNIRTTVSSNQAGPAGSAFKPPSLGSPQGSSIVQSLGGDAGCAAIKVPAAKRARTSILVDATSGKH